MREAGCLRPRNDRRARRAYAPRIVADEIAVVGGAADRNEAADSSGQQRVAPRLAPLDPLDLALRWARARAGALERFEVASAAAPEIPLREQTEKLCAEVNRRSHALGRSVADRFGSIEDPLALADLLLASGIPCARGEREQEDRAIVVRRTPCAESACDARLCDFFREALDGFVCGVSDDLRYSRRASSASRDARCEDVVYSSRRPAARFAPIPAEVAHYLERPLARLSDRGVTLELLGVAERRIHVRASGGSTTSCGLGRVSFDLLAAHLAARFPDYELIDASPRAVMA